MVFWIVVGGLAGWLASLVAGTSARMGCLLNVVVGVVGAVIGGWIFRNLGLPIPAGDFIGPLVLAFVGATVLLLLLRLIARS